MGCTSSHSISMASSEENSMMNYKKSLRKSFKRYDPEESGYITGWQMAKALQHFFRRSKLLEPPQIDKFIEDINIDEHIDVDYEQFITKSFSSIKKRRTISNSEDEDTMGACDDSDDIFFAKLIKPDLRPNCKPAIIGWQTHSK
mmetsp:Transcript_17454/g.22990  ORF Transcript_17454/g.22990 Transcript_17454/m.22990 type:complete len:144 (+) Transcript_17454:3462-3893(+)|eukprot:CAMPEP_0117745528 /NCGR_PEP_ID=MMETSP0947-20121206/7408_1 /TAXON_ID=44440 /ORGANISM="Chattonella subsalsa, Strain CCMP2191" /LENGTH=143 /DNA_ID=CAMNT_0005562685 /DNA_START=604 /DNA_END=1035 /DNA_ORIENTATION=+